MYSWFKKKHKYNKETGFCWKLTWLNVCCVDPHKLVSVRSALFMPPPQSMEYLMYHNAYRLTTPANRNVLWPTASTSNEWVTSAKEKVQIGYSNIKKKITTTILWECYVQHWLTLPEYSDIKPSLVALQMFTDMQLIIRLSLLQFLHVYGTHYHSHLCLIVTYHILDHMYGCILHISSAILCILCYLA